MKNNKFDFNEDNIPPESVIPGEINDPEIQPVTSVEYLINPNKGSVIALARKCARAMLNELGEVKAETPLKGFASSSWS